MIIGKTKISRCKDVLGGFNIMPGGWGGEGVDYLDYVTIGSGSMLE